jgi:hypothetical protein
MGHTVCTEPQCLYKGARYEPLAKIMFNNKKQLLCLNNLSLEMKKELVKSCIWSVALYGSETRTLGKNE